MKKLPKQKLILFSLTLIFFLSLFFWTKKTQAQIALPLTVAPARQELLVDPGE